jgi:hypothetical protein
LRTTADETDTHEHRRFARVTDRPLQQVGTQIAFVHKKIT